ncbi:MAG: hypothetical protein AAFR39_01225 [Pseudomonadota bacterium]
MMKRVKNGGRRPRIDDINSSDERRSATPREGSGRPLSDCCAMRLPANVGASLDLSVSQILNPSHQISARGLVGLAHEKALALSERTARPRIVKVAQFGFRTEREGVGLCAV